MKVFAGIVATAAIATSGFGATQALAQETATNRISLEINIPALNFENVGEIQVEAADATHHRDLGLSGHAITVNGGEVTYATGPSASPDKAGTSYSVSLN